MARRRAGADVVRVEVQGAGELERDFSRAQRELQNLIIRELRSLATRAETILVEELNAEGLVDTGELEEGIRAVFSFRASRPRLTLTSSAERDGYPYTSVTRFGHRKAIIQGNPLLTVHESGSQRSAFRLLPFVHGVGHSPHPDAYRPRDWVRQALPLIDQEVDIAASRLGRRMERELLTGGRVR